MGCCELDSDGHCTPVSIASDADSISPPVRTTALSRSVRSFRLILKEETPVSSPSSRKSLKHSESMNQSRLNLLQRTFSKSEKVLMRMISSKWSNEEAAMTPNSTKEKNKDEFKKSADRRKVVWSDQNNDVLRRQQLMSTIGILARNLGKPDNGTKKIEHLISEDSTTTDPSEEAGRSDNMDESKSRRPPRPWLPYVIWHHMKSSCAGKPEVASHYIFFGTATPLALLGFDSYYLLSVDKDHDMIMLTGSCMIQTI